jgi:hypothetical protein
MEVVSNMRRILFALVLVVISTVSACSNTETITIPAENMMVTETATVTEETSLTITEILTSMATITVPPDLPFPSKPIAKGTISGLFQGTLARLRVVTPKGWVQLEMNRTDGQWQAVIMDTGEDYYMIIAEAEGYSVDPARYDVFVNNEGVFIVGTDDLAENLDFHFIRI